MFFISTGKNITSSSFYTLVSSNTIINHSTITIFDYPGLKNYTLDIKSSKATLKPGGNKIIHSGNGTINETTYNVSINPSINSYTLSIRHNSTTPYNYLLLITNETIGNIVPITGPTKVGSYYNMTTKYQQINVTLNSSYSYDIYAVYYIPITVQTDFLGKPMNFSTFFKYATIPYNTSLLGFNKYKVDENATYYALPPASNEYIPDYSGYTYFVKEGFWNGLFNNTGVYLPSTCFDAIPNITYCFSTTYNGSSVSGGVSYSASRISKYASASSSVPIYANWTKHDLLNGVLYSARGLYNPFSIDQGIYSFMPLPLDYNYEIQINNFTNMAFYSPSTVTLNYGYTIPIFIVYNDNMTFNGFQGGNCNIFGLKTFSSESAYLYDMANNQSLSFVCWQIVNDKKESSSSFTYGFIVSEPSQEVTINLNFIETEHSLQAYGGIGGSSPYNVSLAVENLTGFMETSAGQYNQLYYLYESDSGFQGVSFSQIKIFNYKIPTSPNDQNAYGFYSKIS